MKSSEGRRRRTHVIQGFGLDKRPRIAANSLPMKTAILSFLAFLCLTVAEPTAWAVSPPPDGCYSGFTTPEGCNALQSLTTGLGNTGIGWYSLFANATGNFNTGVGAETLVLNTADSNTAVGAAALLLNTTGPENTAVGADALLHNVAGESNTAVGAEALEFNDGLTSNNTAVGAEALQFNTDAIQTPPLVMLRSIITL